ncbi:MAG: hypothetical protein IT383_01295, partial [Deltaproteobacteria bacterium]|nr:hypothetical protein [Deltaproteobacteria bacterium]
LVDLRNRVYAPHLRGFLTRDPLGNVDSEGLFAYAAGDPINLRDPWGLSTNEPGIGAEDFDPAFVSEGGETVVREKKPKPPATTCDAACQEWREQQAQERIDRLVGRGEEQQRRKDAERDYATGVEKRPQHPDPATDPDQQMIDKHPFLVGFMYGFAQVPLPRPAPPPPLVRPQRIAKLGYGSPPGVLDQIVRAFGEKVCEGPYCPTTAELALLAAMTMQGAKGQSRGPNLRAQGAHTTFRREAGTTGRVTHYETFQPQTNPQNPAPWESVKRFDATGRPHYNKANEQQVPTPHVHDPTTPGGVRPALPDENPLGW